MTAPAPAPGGSQAQPGAVLELVSSVLAPVTVLTALFAYFGWVRTSAYYGYFGVGQDLLGFAPQDYLLQSAQVGFGFVARLLAAAALLVALNALVAYVLVHFVPAHRQPHVKWALTGVGIVLGTVGLSAAVSRTVVGIVTPLVGAGLLALGALLVLRWAPRSATWTRARTIGVTVAILLVSGFWAATIYAKQLGTEAAAAVDGAVERLTLVNVFSDKPLDLPGSLVASSRVPTAEGQYGYRYTGLPLLTYANERWFVISGRLSDGYRSSVVVLRDSDGIRVETAAPR